MEVMDATNDKTVKMLFHFLRCLKIFRVVSRHLKKREYSMFCNVHRVNKL